MQKIHIHDIMSYHKFLLYVVEEMLREKIIKIVENELGSTKEEQNKKATKRLRFVHKLNNKMMHMEEVVIVLVIALFSFMLAHYTGLSGLENEAKNQEIEHKLQVASSNIKPWFEKTRVISQWKVDSDVENTFYKGYCTYGAALISPEFFPYISPKQQQRTRWGNAADRYLNAQLAWFEVGHTPREWALVVYKRWQRFVKAWHVGKVIKYFPKYGKMIVRDMNRVGRWIMSDRREYEDTSNIMWYIYPKPWTVIAHPERIDSNVTKQIPEDVVETSVVAQDLSEVAPLTTPVQEEPVETSPATELLLAQHPSASPEKTTDSAGPQTLDLDFSALSPSAQHFLNQRDITIESQLSNIKLGEEKEIVVHIINKKTWKKFSGILPIALNFVTSSSAITLDYSTIQLIYDGEAVIKAKANTTNPTAVIINFGPKKIGYLKLQAK